MRYKPFEWRKGSQPKRTLCEFCMNAVPNDTYGCEWSDFGEPVPGWEAIPTEFRDHLAGADTRVVNSFCVLKCPKFQMSPVGAASEMELNSLILEDDDEPIERYRVNKMDQLTMLCKYNYGIDCTNRKNCMTCGWNPEIIEQRKKEIEQV